MKRIQKSVRAVAGLCAVVGVFTHQYGYAGAFSLYTESSGAAIGNFAAGIAAEAADASTGWYNPAGLILIKNREAVLSGVGISPSVQLSGTSIYNTTFADTQLTPYVQTFSGLEGGKSAVVPALHYVAPLGERAAFGLSLVSPYGLSTNWYVQSPVRYSGTLTELLTVNLSPELSGRLTNHVSVGAGLDLQWARVRFNSVIGSPAFLQELDNPLTPPTFLDSQSRNTGDSFGVGFHAGILSVFNDNHTRIGLNYQSKMGHVFEGTSVLYGPLASEDPTSPEATGATFSTKIMSNNVQLPDVLTISAYQDVHRKLALLGSLVFTGWNCFQKIQLNNVAAVSSETGLPGGVDVTSNESYRNAWRVALGANYHVTNEWMMRIGGGFDQTPTINAQRDIRLPDVDRWALSIGAHYQMRQSLGFDVGYTYLFASHLSPINKTQTLGTMSSNTIQAEARDRVQLVGLQAVWKPRNA